tara:strand:- start:7379 stop:7618 length:240 start_codon:yes stop_codon:yes gene_type:complete
MPMLNDEYYTLDIQALYHATMEELEELDTYYQSLKVGRKHAHALNQDEHDLIQTCIEKRRNAAELKEKNISVQNDSEPS